MTPIEALFRVNPSAGWIAVACLLFAAELASGKLRFAWAALAALAPALMIALGVRLGGAGELAVFAGLTTLALVLFARERRAIRARAPRVAPPHGLPTPVAETADTPRPALRTSLKPSPKQKAPRPLIAPVGDPIRAPGLIGETGRTLTEFSNGLGRVWLQGAEWGAELVQGEAVPADASVEVVGVSGGVRLRVRALAA